MRSRLRSRNWSLFRSSGRQPSWVNSSRPGSHSRSSMQGSIGPAAPCFNPRRTDTKQRREADARLRPSAQELANHAIEVCLGNDPVRCTALHARQANMVKIAPQIPP